MNDDLLDDGSIQWTVRGAGVKPTGMRYSDNWARIRALQVGEQVDLITPLRGRNSAATGAGRIGKQENRTFATAVTGPDLVRVKRLT